MIQALIGFGLAVGVWFVPNKDVQIWAPIGAVAAVFILWGISSD